jgi:PASTA domain-containing protein/glucodextranase-like protein
MRRLGLLLAAACPLALAACGNASSTASKPPVRLSVDAPGDGAVVRDGTVEISGRVSPAGASVTVLGRSATTVGGSFSASVPLDAGDNVIDVMATAPSARPAMTALRILREITIRVPDVTGDSPNDARSRLEQAGLRANVHESGGLFEDLLPNDPSVCETTPSPGTRVDRGSTVRVRTSKTC